MNVRLSGFHGFELLGEGGFAKVWRARQDGFDREVAVKVLNVGLDDRQRLAFERECRAMGIVSQHPHIVTVYSAGWTAANEPAIVMELFTRGTTADLMRRQGAIDHARVLDIGVKMCGALQTAHHRGLLHRDIKPQNIFLSEFDEPALGDFGISAYVGDEDGVAGFSIHYAAPEVIERRQAGPLSDVYSLGATLYTLLAGRRPFATPGRTLSTREVALRVLRQPPPRLDGVPTPLVDLIVSTLAKRPAERPASAASFGRQLQDLQERLGLPRTRLAVPTDAPSTAPETGIVPEPTATVARPSPRNRRRTDMEPRTPRPRVIASVVAGTVVVAGLAGLGWAVTRSPDPDPVPTTAPVVEPDDPPAIVVPPTSVTLQRGGPDEVVVTWDHPGAEQFEVRRVDTTAAASAAPLPLVDQPRVVLEGLRGAAPCVVVTAIVGNRASRPTDPVCLSEASPGPAPTG